MRVVLDGTVQGVGFRPFVYRLATDLGLKGWVNNSPSGVTIEAEAGVDALRIFLSRLVSEKPQHAVIRDVRHFWLDSVGDTDFRILASESSGKKTVSLLPDLATCPECLKEIFDSQDRRFLYPFTNCIHCGPRFTIIEGIPYDRKNTVMKKFALCPECSREYHDPSNRRFHAQPNACPACGPRLQARDEGGALLGENHDALLAAVKTVEGGRILALKGIGGFQLIADARNEKAVNELRLRKHREEKPFALMFPSIEDAQNACVVNGLERGLLLSPEAPIVLLRRKPGGDISLSVAPENPNLGVMLPYSPLHHILMRELGSPVVATSGNLSDEPICTDNNEAMARLKGIADIFLIHDRPIVRPMDDSVVRVMMDRPLVIRRARGYAPAPVVLPPDVTTPHASVLAVGAHLKNTVTVSVGGNAVISPHIGDLETEESLRAFTASVRDLPRLYGADLSAVACDMHPDYASSQYARRQGLPVHAIQHHHAHVVSCMAENGLTGTVLGVAWDGTGWGHDGTVWGGEFLVSTFSSFRRAAYFRHFRLPGGEKAAREPWRSAMGVLHEMYGKDISLYKDLPPFAALTEAQLGVCLRIMEQNIAAPRTSSAGRIFDAVASLLGLRQGRSFEGQAAMALEFILEGFSTDMCYRFDAGGQQGGGAGFVIDWAPMMEDVIRDREAGTPTGEISARFHNTMAEVVVKIARQSDLRDVCLTGGCFQNRYLTERAVRRLREEGFVPHWHRYVPCNDGGISFGQAVAALQRMKEER
ncbi:MAG: carbamoyltransferase HypF [Candidatus Omnitrophota bacterium]|nr:carbamoyltransferase HypF [Candidatus Omnitrophota bacterium]